MALAAPAIAAAGGGLILATLARELMDLLEGLTNATPAVNEAADPVNAVFALVPALGLAAMRSECLTGTDVVAWAGVFKDYIACVEGA